MRAHSKSWQKALRAGLVAAGIFGGALTGHERSLDAFHVSFSFWLVSAEVRGLGLVLGCVPSCAPGCGLGAAAHQRADKPDKPENVRHVRRVQLHPGQHGRTGHFLKECPSVRYVRWGTGVKEEREGEMLLSSCPYAARRHAWTPDKWACPPNLS